LAEVNTRLQLIVRRGNQLSVPEEIVVAPAQPAIFSRDGSGTGLGHIYTAGPGGSLVPAVSANPASAGQVIIIYAAGLGAVNPPIPDNEAAPSIVLARTVDPVTLTIGGVRAEVSFSGLAPGFTGLYQVNAVVPAGVSPGDAVPVVLTVSGQSSPAVSMAVR
jgi:adhesin/invasin